MARPGEGPIDFGEIEHSCRNDKTHKFNRIKTIGKSLLFQRAIRGYAHRIPNKYGRKNNGVLYAPLQLPESPYIRLFQRYYTNDMSFLCEKSLVLCYVSFSHRYNINDNGYMTSVHQTITGR